MSCTLWKCCTIIVLTSTVVLAIAIVLGMWLGHQKGALCPIDSASSLLIFPVCLNMEDVTLESLLTGSHRGQIIDLLRKHVKDDQVQNYEGQSFIQDMHKVLPTLLHLSPKAGVSVG